MSIKQSDVAIIGMGCRLPGADSVEAFWEMLKNGSSGITDTPKERWDIDAYYDADPMKPGKMNAKKGGYISNIKAFDAAFFNISPKEAESIDPQQRLMLELTWEALEDAGILPGSIKGSDTGVFVGSCSNDFSTMVFGNDANHPYAGTGTTNCIIANRVSYAYDLKGPSLSYDTACASSLVAVINSCKSIIEGECNLAIVGGVHLTLLPNVTVSFSKAGLISASNICRPFDERADGYLRSEGAGVMILKSAELAKKDGDDIYAIIKGGAINHNGRGNGLSAPNPKAQEEVLKLAYQHSDISSMEALGYIEAQGIGTRFADALELKAIGSFLAGNYEHRSEPVRIGSLKSNIGHTEAASGMLSLIKVALSLKKGYLPATINFEQANSMVDLEKLNLQIQHDLTLWPKDKKYAGVSAFGFGGVNSHVVLEKVEEKESDGISTDQTPLILTLSAKSEPSLKMQCTAMGTFIAKNLTLDLKAICDASAKRTHFNYRVAIPFLFREELLDKLQDYKINDDTDGLIKEKAGKKVPQIAFLFTGNHSQYKDMGKGLYESFPVFKQAFDECDRIAETYLNEQLHHILYEPSNQDLNQHPEFYHLSIFSLEYSLSVLWKSWGIEPAVVMGSSLGEYAAACVAGVFSLEDAIYLVYNRAALFSRMPRNGAIIVAFAEYEYLEKVLVPYQDKVVFAGFNGPKHHLLAGYKDNIQEIAARLEQDFIKVFTLNSPVAYHSFLMEPIKEEWLGILAKVQFKSPTVPFVSTVTGDFCNQEVAEPGYWYKHITGPVHFQRCVAELKAKNYDAFIEIGPKPTMITLAAELYQNNTKLWLPSISEGTNDVDMIMKSLAILYVNGCSINWKGYFNIDNYPKLQLPSYQFDKQELWPESLSTGVFDSNATEGIMNKLILSEKFSPEQLQLIVNALESQNSKELPQVEVISPSAPVAHEGSIVEQLFDCKDSKVQQSLIEDYMVHLASSVMRIKHGQTNRDVSLFNQGMDSLMAIEIKERLAKDLNIEVDIPLLMDVLSIKELAAKLLGSFSQLRTDFVDHDVAEDPDHRWLKILNDISKLGEQQLDQLIAELRDLNIENNTQAQASLAKGDEAGFEGLWMGKKTNYADEIKEKATFIRSAIITMLSSSFSTHQAAENQKALWYAQKNSPEDHSYHIAFSVKIHSPVNLAVFQTALQVVFDRHDELRSTFYLSENQLIKRTVAYAKVDFELIQVDDLQQDDVLDLVKERHRRLFDLEHGPLFKSYLFVNEQTADSIFLLNIHHIIIDGQSYWTLLNEFSDVYESLLHDKLLAKSSPVKHYNDYVTQQADMLVGTEGERLLKYWQTELSGELEPLSLPFDKARPLKQNRNGGSFAFSLTSELSEKLQALSEQLNVTLFSILLTGFQTLLHRYSNQNKILVGTPLGARSSNDYKDVVGYFVNSGVIKAEFSPDKTFTDLLLETKRRVNAAIEHQAYPFSLLVKKLKIQHDPLITPIFQVMFDFASPRENDTMAELFANLKGGKPTEWGSLLVEPSGIVNEEAQFDLSLRVYSSKQTLTGFFKYNADLFEESTISRLKESYILLLESIADNVDSSISKIPIIPKATLNEMLYSWNSTEVALPESKFIYHIIDGMAINHPDKIAAVYGEQKITYAGLAQQSNQFASFLGAEGIKPGDIVPVLLNRSIDMLIAILGIFKAGAIYLPLDEMYPISRILAILEETEAREIVSDVGSFRVLEQAYEQMPPTFQKLLLFTPTQAYSQIPTSCFEPNRYNSEKNYASITPEDVCYMIYTSGSTGKPKGVLVQHKGMLNHLFSKVNTLKTDSETVIVQNAASTFDISIWQFFTALLTGGKTVIIPEKVSLDIFHFAETIDASGVTILEVVPSYLNVLLRELQTPGITHFNNLNYLMVTGETVKPQLVQRWFEKYPGIPLVNAYGPTEASDDITHYIMHHANDFGIIPIGKPVQNMKIYIVDANGQPCPIGVKGEIWTSGIGVGKGYFKDPEKTRKAFSTDPFLNNQIPLYKTGDIGSFLPDGNILFFGRQDSQVKIKGFRIELGEIEQVMLGITGVEDVAVKVFTEKDNSFIAAYIQINDPSLLEEIKASTHKLLPYYMVPDHYTVFDKLPLNSNGKIDRKRLIQPDLIYAVEQTPWEPQDEKETILLQVWREVLEVNNIGANASIFSLGGDSISSMHIVARLRVKGLSISAENVFQYPTIPQLAAVAKWIEEDEADAGEIVTWAPLTPIQRWLLEQEEQVQSNYSMAVQINVPALLDAEVIASEIKQLLNIHTQLQASFPRKEIQLINELEDENLFLVIEVNDLGEGQLLQQISHAVERVSQAFNVENGHLFKAVLFTSSAGPQKLVLISHHLVIDHLSWQILFNGLIARCNNAMQKLEHLPVVGKTVYLSWATTLTAYAKRPEVLQDIIYWVNECNTLTQYKEKARYENIANLSVTLDAKASNQLINEVHSIYNTNTQDVLLTALMLSYYSYFRQAEVVIELENNGRFPVFDERTDVMNTVGWFAHQYPVKLVYQGKGIGENIKWVKEKLLNVPHRGISYGLLKYHEDATISGQFQELKSPEILFNYLGKSGDEKANGVWGIEPLHIESLMAKKGIKAHSLEFNVLLVNGQFKVMLTYDCKQHDAIQMRSFLETFLDQMKQIIADCGKETEKQYTVSDFAAADISEQDLAALLKSLK